MDQDPINNPLEHFHSQGKYMTETEIKDLNTWLTACRTNTGKHICDSGDYYGRHYEQPPILPAYPSTFFAVEQDGTPYSGIIETAFFLHDSFILLHDMQEQFEKYAEEEANKYSSWWDSAEDFFEEIGYVQVVAGNTYNSDNDLTQDFNYNIWLPEGDSRDDWIYADNAIVTIHVHTGCDVRSGYTKPYFCKTKGDSTIPIDYTAGYVITHAEDSEGNEVDSVEYDYIDENWSPGTVGYVWQQVEEDILKWYPELTKYEHGKAVECTALLKDGTTKVTIVPTYYTGY